MSRFKGWTCQADAEPEPGRYHVGLAGTDDDKPYHVVTLWREGGNWTRADGSVVTNPPKPERTFYRSTFYQGDAP